MGDNVHGSAVLVGTEAVLIRGPSGSGKSLLAFELICAGKSGLIAPTLLIGDDRLRLTRRDNTIEVGAVAILAGLIEIRGLGLRRCAHCAAAPLALVVDLAATDGTRLPPLEALRTDILGIIVPRIPVPAGFTALPLVIAALTTEALISD